MGLGANLQNCRAWLDHLHECKHGCGTPGGDWCPSGIGLWLAVHQGMVWEEFMRVHPPGWQVSRWLPDPVVPPQEVRP